MPTISTLSWLDPTTPGIKVKSYTTSIQSVKSKNHHATYTIPLQINFYVLEPQLPKIGKEIPKEEIDIWYVVKPKKAIAVEKKYNYTMPFSKI